MPLILKLFKKNISKNLKPMIEYNVCASTIGNGREQCSSMRVFLVLNIE